MISKRRLGMGAKSSRRNRAICVDAIAALLVALLATLDAEVASIMTEWLGKDA